MLYAMPASAGWLKMPLYRPSCAASAATVPPVSVDQNGRRIALRSMRVEMIASAPLTLIANAKILHTVFSSDSASGGVTTDQMSSMIASGASTLSYPPARLPAFQGTFASAGNRAAIVAMTMYINHGARNLTPPATRRCGSRTGSSSTARP